MSIEWEIKKKIKEKNKRIQEKYEMIKEKKDYFKKSKCDNLHYNFDIFDIFIHLMPEDIINLISTFLNPKEIIAVERINKINKKQYEKVNRSVDNWINHLKQYPFLYTIKSIECINEKKIILKYFFSLHFF